MAHQKRPDSRRHLGYGSTYRKGDAGAVSAGDEIPTVFGGQVWMIKPDKMADAHNPCLWMAAGVVKYKNCTNFYDCTACKFDTGMRNQVERGKKISWQAAMRKKHSIERICRHSLTNRMANRLCGYDYQCARCDFDQVFEDVMTPKTSRRPAEILQVKGFDVPMDYYFHDGHSWARIESGGYIRIGMDDFALKVLGRADAYDLPLTGKELDSGKAGWGLKRKDKLADVLAPIDGVIVEVNPQVNASPSVTNRDPYGDGWLFTAYTPDIKATVKKLMPHTSSTAWISAEVGKLEAMIEDVAGPMAADGGYLTEDIYGNLPDLGWHNLTQTFLKT